MRNRFSLLVLLLVSLALFGPIWTSDAVLEPEFIAREYVRTAAAASQDSACDAQFGTPTNGSGHTCTEWCNVLHGLPPVPTGLYCCKHIGEHCVERMW